MHFSQLTGVKRRIALALRIAATLALAATSVRALAYDDATTRKDVQVTVRALAFLAPPPTGPVPVAIIFAPENAASAADAQAAKGWFESEGRIGSLELRPTLVRSTDLDQLNLYRIAFVARGSEGFYERIAGAANRAGVLTISADPGCARNAYCAMSVVGEPKVEITISHAATTAARVQFSTAFRILVNEQ